jgi:hypothetical protein
MKRKRTQQNWINSAEYRTVRPYSERQGQDGYDGKAWALAELPQRIPKLRKRDVHLVILERPFSALVHARLSRMASRVNPLRLIRNIAGTRRNV